MPTTFIPHVQVRNNGILVYERPAVPNPRQYNTTGLKNTYSGKVSTGAQKRIRKAIDILLQTTPQRTIWNPVSEVFHPFRLSFITLTISEQKKNLTAREGYNLLLKDWLRWANRKGVKSFIWKAELQERGQLHYHVTTNQFLHYMDIQKEWNKLQKSNSLLDGYAKKYGHFNPNSTDVHSVKNIKNFEAYLSKYLAKCDQNEKATDGKIWDCSSDLKRDRFSEVMDYETNDLLRAALHGGFEKVTMEHCQIIKTPNPEKLLSPTILQQYQKWK